MHVMNLERGWRRIVLVCSVGGGLLGVLLAYGQQFFDWHWRLFGFGPGIPLLIVIPWVVWGVARWIIRGFRH